MARSPNHLAPAFQSALSLPEAVAATSLQRVLLTDPSVLQASPWPLPSRRLQGRRVFADRQVTTNTTRYHSGLCFLPRLLLLLQLSGRESRTCWPPVPPSSGDVLDNDHELPIGITSLPLHSLAPYLSALQHNTRDQLILRVVHWLRIQLFSYAPVLHRSTSHPLCVSVSPITLGLPSIILGHNA